MTVVDVDSKNWDNEVSTGDKMVVVEFWHEGCPWCEKFKPIYEEVSEEYGDQAKFTRLNALETDENKTIAIENGVMSTPTLAFYCRGRSLGSAMGFQPKERLQHIIDDMIERRKECIEQSSEFPR